jgi:ElaB/YqjD/DUF883 family membrane-anchored ribosome-binding protein
MNEIHKKEVIRNALIDIMTLCDFIEDKEYKEIKNKINEALKKVNGNLVKSKTDLRKKTLDIKTL